MSTMANWTLPWGCCWIHAGNRVHVGYTMERKFSLCGRSHPKAPTLPRDQRHSIDPTPVCGNCERVLAKREAEEGGES